MCGEMICNVLGNGWGRFFGLLILEILYFFFVVGEEVKINFDFVLFVWFMMINLVVNGFKFFFIYLIFV